MRIPGLLSCGAALVASACGTEPPGERLVLVTIDTLRADSLSPERMPETAAFAARGLVFARGYASTSTTQPTHASLLTGLHPWEHGVTRNGQVLAERLETVAERLAAAGFATHAVVASFPLHGRFGFAQGFDAFRDEFHEPYVRVWEGERLEDGRFYSLAGDVTTTALDELDAMRGERQFLWVHYFDPHDPYGDAAVGEKGGGVVGISDLLSLAAAADPRAPDAVRAARARYDDDVLALDRALGRLFERLAADADRFRTHVLFTSDHGESFGEKGALGHGKRVTPEQVQVPLFVVSPGLRPEVRRDAAGSIDVPRTLLAMAGLAPGSFPGRDLLAAPTPGGERTLVLGMRRSFSEPKVEVLVDGRRRAVEGARFFAAGEERLFAGDAAAVVADDDPARPLEGDDARAVRALFEELERRLAGAHSEELLDPEVQEALRRLGYAR